MDESTARLEARLDELARRIETLEKRVAAEAHVVSLEGESAPDAAVVAPPPPPLLPVLESFPAFAGRSCLVLGGAFLLRFATESGALSAPIGAALGVLYAFGVLFATDRAAAAGRTTSALFHLLSASVILFPLLGEATARLDAFPPLVTIGLLAAAVVAGIYLSIQRELRAAAPVLFGFSLVTATILMFASHHPGPFATFLLVLGATSLLLAGTRGWTGLALSTALACDGAVLLLVALSTGTNRPEWITSAPIGPIQIGLAAVYFGGFGLFLVSSDFTAGPVTWLQSAMAFFIGFEAALPRLGETRAIAGGFALGVAVLSGLAAWKMERQGRALSSFAWAAVFGAAFAVEGSRLVLPDGVAPAAWGALAVLLAGMASGPRRRPLLLGAAGTVILVAIGTDMIPASLRTFLGPVMNFGETPSLPFVFAAVALLATWALAARHPEKTLAESFLRALPLALGLLGIGTVIVHAVASSTGAGAGGLATVRSAVLVAAAIILALTHRLTGRPELRALGTAALVAEGAKLLFDELALGKAGPIVAGLALYGLALIVAPRLARRASDAAPATA